MILNPNIPTMGDDESPAVANGLRQGKCAAMRDDDQMRTVHWSNVQKDKMHGSNANHDMAVPLSVSAHADNTTAPDNRSTVVMRHLSKTGQQRKYVFGAVPLHEGLSNHNRHLIKIWRDQNHSRWNHNRHSRWNHNRHLMYIWRDQNRSHSRLI